VECWCALVELAGFEGRAADIRSFLDELSTAESRYDLALNVTLLETACAAASKIQDYVALGKCANRLLATSRTIGYREGEAAGYAYAGRAALRLFDVDRAHDALERAAGMFASMGQRLKEVAAAIEIGNLHTSVGRFAQAIARFEAAAAIAASISYGYGVAACFNNISYTASLDGNFALARSAAFKALDAANSIESRSGRAHALISAGVAERELDDLANAIAHLEEGTAIERELNESVALGEDLCELIIALLRAGRTERASLLADEVLAMATDPDRQFSNPQLLFWTVATVRHATGQRARARALLAYARKALDERESAIPDPASRATFRGLRYNRAIDDAFDRNSWRT
jgi:tetratricopeptide (TPR) repeat protein